MKITAVPNSARTDISFPSEYNRLTFLSWLKKYKAFSIEPIEEESVKSRRYLEGAVIPAYCHWQYKVDPRGLARDEQRRFLFKRDFNYEVVTNRKGNPVRTPVSSKGKAKEITEKYTAWAEQNGAPIPNPELFKLWRDKWSQDRRFPTFHEFLDFLGIECDAMPSTETMSKLGTAKASKVPEAKEDYKPTVFD